MIIFELACGQGHRFEGWFASSDDFARQSEAEMVRCPVCDDPGVARVPSAKVFVRAENVGPRFPEEARKIHYDEAPSRAIRGQASKEESAELAEEGIDVATLPDFLLRETH